MMVGLLWPLVVVSFWLCVFVLAIALAVRFTREPALGRDEALDGGTRAEMVEGVPGSTAAATTRQDVA